VTNVQFTATNKLVETIHNRACELRTQFASAGRDKVRQAMAIKQQIIKQLQALAASGTGPFMLNEAVSNGRVTATIHAADRLACAFESLQLETPNLAAKSIDELKQLSNTLCAKVSYLLEPIALIESDVDACTTQLRSNPPAKEDDQTFYYEIVVRRGGTISLCRYQKQPGDVRQMMPANLTHEVFARVAEDFVAAAGN
jgi:hypothetical protein